MLFRRSWFPITVSLCNKLCMINSSPVEIYTKKSSSEPEQHSRDTSSSSWDQGPFVWSFVCYTLQATALWLVQGT